jgi:hypothetical protein
VIQKSRERKFHAGFKAIDFRFQKQRISLNTQKNSRSSTLLFLFSFLLGIVQPVTSKHVPCHVLGLEVKLKKTSWTRELRQLLESSSKGAIESTFYDGNDMQVEAAVGDRWQSR